MEKTKEQIEVELKKTLEKINLEIKALNDYSNNPDRKKLSVIYDKMSDKRSEQRAIKQKIRSRYLKAQGRNVWGWRRNSISMEMKNIVSSVKQGIKRGVGIKYISSADEKDILKVVKSLIDEDLKQTNYNELETEILKLDKEQKKIEDELNKKDSELELKKQKIEDELNKEQTEKDNAIKKQKEDISKMINEKIINNMENIRREVEKGLMCDALSQTE